MSAELFKLIFDASSLLLGLGKCPTTHANYICSVYPIWRSYKVVEAKKFDNELI